MERRGQAGERLKALFAKKEKGGCGGHFEAYGIMWGGEGLLGIDGVAVGKEANGYRFVVFLQSKSLEKPLRVGPQFPIIVLGDPCCSLDMGGLPLLCREKLARIKKIMQADEDVGKIAMAVPVLVSKALELFLQDLCDRTYDITLQRGAKTVNSLHLKHCVQSYNVFDFLREVVSKVPDYGHSDASTDDRTMSKRRKTTGDELNDSDDESKRSRMVRYLYSSPSNINMTLKLLGII
ncbi:hypothetical protein F0562_013537 [Nyssa sinensis]|uniref:Transcription factor CBF/NF-Y/archaeal histone domain-containing protein n=1 Tax=Nyssa sinensis TaxID=561372 RepID=A0A5J4ZQD7_9ASTE|nr:hypothetical protein F0562_013537 [Nyssa sinensis]